MVRQRRLHTFSVKDFDNILRDGEKLMQAHSKRGEPTSTLSVAVAKAKNEVRELGCVRWRGDGEKVLAPMSCLGRGGPSPG